MQAVHTYLRQWHILKRGTDVFTEHVQSALLQLQSHVYTYVNDNDLPKIISPLLVTIAALCFVLFVSQKFTPDFCAHTELRMQYNTTCSSGNSCDV